MRSNVLLIKITKVVVIICYAVHCVHVTHAMIGNRHHMSTLMCLASETYWLACVVILCSDPGIGVHCCAHIMVSSAVTKGISHCVCMYTKVFHLMLNYVTGLGHFMGLESCSFLTDT